MLEPGCGSGNFLGFAPPGCDLVGVEADRTTARIAHHLYGRTATVHATRFEHLELPAGSFDLAIGNVPFGKVAPHDPRHNRNRHALHNYFLLKSLHLVRPGGLVIAITSRYTLDARNPAARREMASLADLVGAARLPAGAFRASSGTDVVCDIVMLRRRSPGRKPAGLAWERAIPLDLGGDEPLLVNELLAARADLVLGRLTSARGMYREHELTVEASGELRPHLDRTLHHLVDAARDAGLGYAARASSVEITAADATPAAVAGEEGSFVLAGTGVARIEFGQAREYAPRNSRDLPELRRLIELRDAARTVLDTQVRAGSDDDLAAVQGALDDCYRSHLRLYGPINRYRTARTGRVDDETGEEIMRRIRPRMGGFRDDPDWPLVAALEVFDDETQQARPAAIFTERVVSPPVERHGVDSASEALAVALDETGTADLERLAELLGTEPDVARAELGEQVFEDPTTGELVPASRYMSGNVRAKLAAARAAAGIGGQWAANVAALEGVLPRQLEPGEITAGLGAPWIPAGDVEAFCAEVLGAEVEVEHLASLGRWSIALRVGRRASVSLSSEWGTARADAISLLDASLNRRLYTVTDETPEGRRIRNDAETIAARDKQDALADRFSTWVWQEPARASRLADRYNELFFSVVVPAHDGSHLTLPGLAGNFHPHPHQRDAVART